MWPGDGCVNHKSTDQEVYNKTKVRIYLCKICFVFISFVWGILSEGFLARGVFVQGVLSGGLCPGVFVLIPCRGTTGFCPEPITFPDIRQ